MRAKIDVTQTAVENAHDTYETLSGDILSATQRVFFTHWFDGLNEQYLFREDRPRDAPNRMETNLSVAGGIDDVQDLEANQLSGTSLMDSLVGDNLFVEDITQRVQIDTNTGAIIMDPASPDPANPVPLRHLIELTIDDLNAITVNADSMAVTDRIALESGSFSVATDLDVQGDVSIQQPSASYDTSTHTSLSIPDRLTQDGTQTRATTAIIANDMTAGMLVFDDDLSADQLMSRLLITRTLSAETSTDVMRDTSTNQSTVRQSWNNAGALTITGGCVGC